MKKQSLSQLNTPFYRIQIPKLDADIELLHNSLEKSWGNFIMAYSVKTNSLPWLLCHMKSRGFYGEVVSATEYDLLMRLGFSKDKIIYNGPIKDRQVFEEVLLNNGLVNMDSNQELSWIRELSEGRPDFDFRVGLRINCNLAELCPDIVPDYEEGGRFGYCYENGVLAAAMEEIGKLPNVSIEGLHLHSSTAARTTEVYGALASFACKIAEEYRLELSYVDMGGGYYGGLPDKPDYRDYFPVIARELKRYFDPEKTTLIAEPGVSLISSAISFETTVLDVKSIRDVDYIVTDGSRVNLNPQVTRHVYPHHILYRGEPFDSTEGNPVKNQEKDKEINQETIQENTEKNPTRKKAAVQWVCGYTCMEYDRLFEIKNDAALLPGDRIIYDNAGGYTMCLNPLFINYLPAVYVEDEHGDIFTAREAWGNEEYLALNRW